MISFDDPRSSESFQSLCNGLYRYLLMILSLSKVFKAYIISFDDLNSFDSFQRLDVYFFSPLHFIGSLSITGRGPILHFIWRDKSLAQEKPVLGIMV